MIINGDDSNCNYIIENCNRNTITYGLNSSNDCYAENIRYEKGKPIFDAIFKGEKIPDVKLSVFGNHNIMNALSAICVAKLYSVKNEYIISGLLAFKGADRRFEIKKEYNGALIVDDYAHHPTEIRATISSAKSGGFSKTTVIFQPHTYTRTKFLLEDFANELSNADEVILTDIYSAREINTVGISILDLKAKINNSVYISDFNEIAEYIKRNAKKDELYILMGAGNINSVSDLI